jgi:hypothetical protein
MARRKTILVIILIILCGWSQTVASELLIADFNRGRKPNLIGGDFGAWNKNKWDRTQFCIESFTTNPDIVLGGRGCSLRIDYDVDSPKIPAYNGFWMKLERIDLTPYRYLSFYVKGDKKRGFTTDFTVIIRNIDKEETSFMVKGIDKSWQKVLIPLEAMKQDADFNEAEELLIVFCDQTATEKTGTLYIDRVALEY